jgi:hypothetical protein
MAKLIKLVDEKWLKEECYCLLNAKEKCPITWAQECEDYLEVLEDGTVFCNLRVLKAMKETLESYGFKVTDTWKGPSRMK